MGTATAADITRRITEATREKREAEEEKYWSIVHGLANEDADMNAEKIAKFLADAGRDAAQFVRDVATVAERYRITDQLDTVPSLRERVAAVIAKQDAAIKAFEATRAAYQAENDKFNREVKELTAQIASIEAGRGRLIQNCPYGWLLARQQGIGQGLSEVESRRRMVNEQFQTATHWANVDPDRHSRPGFARQRKEEAERDLPKLLACLRELDAERASLHAERAEIEAEILKP